MGETKGHRVPHGGAGGTTKEALDEQSLCGEQSLGRAGCRLFPELVTLGSADILPWSPRGDPCRQAPTLVLIHWPQARGSRHHSVSPVGLRFPQMSVSPRASASRPPALWP